MLAAVSSATLLGVEGRPVVVEVHVSGGLPGFTVVGLPDAPCREARDRVRAALLSSGIAWPQRRITVNLAPAFVRKGGAALDLAIAIGVLVASGTLPADRVAGRSFLGELGLDGSVRRFPGAIPLVDALPGTEVVIAAGCAREATMVTRRRVRPVEHLRGLLDALCGTAPWPAMPDASPPVGGAAVPDLADVRGQPFARFALEVAAAGSHHLLLTGPPGAGKTMLARRLPGLLPPLSLREAIEVLRIRSAAGLTSAGESLPAVRPFRAPHHGASAVALIGGGSAAMRPGELSMAHHGVLFLDELGEFPGSVLDALRQPLEEGVVRVARARAAASFPASFLLVAATNPCPCGWSTVDVVAGETDDAVPACRCGPRARERYGQRISGPLLDRFDLRVEMSRPLVGALVGGAPGEATAPVATRVAAARAIASARGVRANAELDRPALDRWAPLDRDATLLVEQELRRGRLTARGLDRVRRVARTLADLEGGADGPLGEQHVSTALELRRAPSFEATVS